MEGFILFDQNLFYVQLHAKKVKTTQKSIELKCKKTAATKATA